MKAILNIKIGNLLLSILVEMKHRYHVSSHVEIYVKRSSVYFAFKIICFKTFLFTNLLMNEAAHADLGSCYSS